MIKNLNTKELYHSDLFVSEVVDEANAAITAKPSKKIILAGSRGSGRSIVLHTREKESAWTGDPAILTRFDAVGMFGTKDDDVFNREVMAHYYEILMSKKILNYIRQYYPQVFEKEFRKVDIKVREKLLDIDHYINDAYYKPMKIQHKLISGEISSEIMSKFRKATGAESVTLMIDRFDWTHNSDPRVQAILKRYFDMFEKVIITTDDKKANSLKGVASLIDKGFEVAAIGYGQSAETVEEIVRRRFALSDEYEEGRKVFPISDVSGEVFESLVEKSNGNIDVILNTFREADTLYQWDGKDFDPNNQLEKICGRELNKVKQLRKMGTPRRLHI